MKVSFRELHHHLQLDPYFGIRQRGTDEVLAELSKQWPDQQSLAAFRYRFSLLPCSSERQRELIYLWCGVLGLPAYCSGTSERLNTSVLPADWLLDFDIALDELQEFLRDHGWPLPCYYFAREWDNTRTRSRLPDDEYGARRREYFEELPALERRLRDLESVKTLGIKELDAKEQELTQLRARIKAIRTGTSPARLERTEETKRRYADWQRQIDRLAAANPNLNHSKLCALLVRDPQYRDHDPATIRRRTTKPRLPEILGETPAPNPPSAPNS